MWDACMNRSLLQVGATVGLDSFLVGHLLLKTNRQFQFVDMDTVGAIRLGVGLDVVAMLAQACHVALVYCTLFSAAGDKRWRNMSVDMVRYYEATVVMHKLVAGFVVIVALQLASLAWHRSTGEMLATTAVLLDFSLAFLLLGFYGLHNESRTAMAAYCAYLAATLIACTALLFSLFSISATPLYNVSTGDELPQPLSNNVWSPNSFQVTLNRYLQIENPEPLFAHSPVPDISGNLPGLFKEIIFPCAYLLLGMFMLSLICLVFSLRLMGLFGNRLNQRALNAKHPSPKTMFQLAHVSTSSVLNSKLLHAPTMPLQPSPRTPKMQATPIMLSPAPSFVMSSSPLRPPTSPLSLRLPTNTYRGTLPCYISPPAPTSPLFFSFTASQSHSPSNKP
ncbi:hypothetical protein DSO57_1003422 [Entomophthora muscae]|uniref:Uncharacterized protein n=1 Tax=Entomophthora muscae TaxID=34485 RepID=A0ACC2UI56_9FUNG|nr:hypothetical protein DSO57_1003422 [Entomophthora muscae]